MNVHTIPAERLAVPSPAEEQLNKYITAMEQIARRVEMQAHSIWGNQKEKVALFQIVYDIRDWARKMDFTVETLQAEKADRESRLDEVRLALWKKEGGS